MNKWITYFILLLALLSCKHKKKDRNENKGPYFSVVSFIQSQVKNVDTSLYRITKIESSDSRSDTTIISREAFRECARDFLSLPDITSAKQKENYDESTLFDEVLNNVLLTYTPINPEDEIRRETVMLQPDESGNSQVKTIIVNQMISAKDSTVEKDLTWHVDRRFQVVTKVTKPNEPEKIRTLVVEWQ
ncbi:MAG: hypothetical protein ACJ75B_15895 [Flavisolibacter sp.]